MQDNLQINWYPGHMKKASEEIRKKLQSIDFVIEVIDARGIGISSNDELKQLIQNKPKITIALKTDLSDLNQFNNDVILCSIKNINDKRKILNYIHDIYKQKIINLKNKGLLQPEFVGLVIGIPNVGKSSLINFLTSTKTLKTENRSGVTKRQALRKIDNTFYLIDTPGIFPKNITSFEMGSYLVVLNCIKRDVVPLHDVLKVIYNYFVIHYLEQLKLFYEFNLDLDYEQFLVHVCKKYKFLSSNNEYDSNRAYQFILDNFSNSLVCKFHFQ